MRLQMDVKVSVMKWRKLQSNLRRVLLQGQQSQLQLSKPGLSFHKSPLPLNILLQQGFGVASRNWPRHGLGSGRIHINPPSLHDCTLEHSSGIGGFTRIAHGHKSKAFGPFLIEDDLGINHSTILAEENHQVWVPEAKGEI